MLQGGATVKDAAAAFGISKTTAHKWVARFRAEEADGLENRSPDPTGRTAEHPGAHPWSDRSSAVSNGGPESGWQPNWDLGIHREPPSSVSEIEQDERSQAPSGHYPLRTQDIGRDHPHGHKVLWCFTKPGHRVTGQHTGMAHIPGAG